jgi:hypothetical protein
MTDSGKFPSPSFSQNVIVIVGGFGSGKSEVSVNLARLLARSGNQVSIADLDIVNPYFRSRETAVALAAMGIKSLIPEGAYAMGGDDTGARVLSSLADAFTPGRYELLLVLNAYRPFTADVAGTLRIMEEIETAGKLKFTGLISNSHLIEQTTVAEVLHGLNLTRQVSDETGLPVAFVSAVESVVRQLDPGKIPCPVLAIDRSLLKPWERSASA